jgi:peptide/nickel transport system permease protein
VAAVGSSVPGHRRSRRRRYGTLLLVGACVLGAIVLAALLADVLSPLDPTQQDLRAARIPPAWSAEGSWEHPLGTDFLGRDLWSRILHGARTTLATSVAAALGAALVGVTLGFVAGYAEGKLGSLIMRLVDLMLAFPLIIMALALVAALGPSIQNLIIALIVTGWMIYARVVRAAVITLKGQAFIQAAQALGVGDVRIILRHLLPNVSTIILVLLPMEIARIIITESALSFLGLGVPPPTPSWGRMLAESRLYLTLDYWIAVFPGLAITLTVLGVSFLGDGLRDFLDPRLKNLL